MKALISAAIAAATLPMAAQGQLFDFEGAATGTYTTLSQTSGGITLDLSRQNGLQFRISNINGFDAPASFGSATLDPFNNPTTGAFIADFSTGLGAISVDLGDYNQDGDTLTLSIFSGLGGTGTLLGTQTIAYSAVSTFPDDVVTLSLASATAFRSAVFNGGSTDFPNSVYYDNISVRAVAGVPEPAAWAMMIGGFGLAGTALRRRRTVRVAFA